MKSTDGAVHHARRPSIFAAVFLGLALPLGLAACSPTKTDRVRITVDVTDGRTVYSGSAVQELQCRQADPMWGNMDTGNCEIRGEAIAIDMEHHGPLFMIFAAKLGYSPGPYIGTIWGARPNAQSQSWTLDKANLPLFIRFADLNVPATVTAVDPGNIEDTHSHQVFVKDVRVDVTNDALTRGRIARFLPWLNDIGNKNLEGRFQTNGINLSGKLMTYHFVSGF